MPKFIDEHGMKPLTAQKLRELKKEPPDEYGVVHRDILFSEKEDKAWCVLEAPDRTAVEKHHAKAGVKCDWIYEVETAV